MDKISYKYVRDGEINVFLGRKKVGQIIKETRGYQYFPIGGSTPGEIFDTLDRCKDSIEGDK